MAKYFCAWKDNRGVEHSSEELALQAEVRYEEERKERARVERIKHGLTCNINGDKLPYLRYNYPMYYDKFHYYDQSNRNKEELIAWIIKNEKGIKEALNG